MRGHRSIILRNRLSGLSRLARRLTHPYSAWVVIRALTLALGMTKLLLWGDFQPGALLAGVAAVLWVGWLAVPSLPSSRPRQSPRRLTRSFLVPPGSPLPLAATLALD